MRIFPWLISILALSALWYFYARPEKEEVTESVHLTVVTSVEKLGKLELVKFHIRDIVEHKIIKKFLPNPSAILIISGEAVACIDLTKITVDDVSVLGDTIQLILPPPELCYAKIDHQNSKVYRTEYILFEEAKLVDEAYKVAERKISEAAIKSGILTTAEANAEIILKPILETVTGKTVFITFLPHNQKLLHN